MRVKVLFALLAGCSGIGEDSAGERRPGAVHYTLGEQWKAVGTQVGEHFGDSLASAGDVDGDRFTDIIVGAPNYQPEDLSHPGRAVVYLGSPVGPAATPVWSAEGDENSAAYGSAVASAGDVNADGFDDILVGAPGDGGGGSAFLYFGSPTGPSLTSDWSGATGRTQSYGYGHAVASAGDVNGDGFDDVAVGELYYDGIHPAAGRATVYLGSAIGPSITPDWIVDGDAEGRHLGTALESGDVNGDGISDLVVGASAIYAPEPSDGAAYVYLGSPFGLAVTPAWTGETEERDSKFGFDVSSGDVNGDGFDDVVVGTYAYDADRNNDTGDTDPSNAGAVYLFLGSSVGVETEPAWRVASDEKQSMFGSAVSAEGDVDADGFADILVGSRGHSLDSSSDVGAVALYLGSAEGPDVVADWLLEGTDSGSWLGAAVAWAGDVNRCGTDDVLVGAPYEAFGEGAAYFLAADSVGNGLPDADGDGVPNLCDLCFDVPDPGQEDEDADGVGDACDPCPPGAPDADRDGTCQTLDCDDGDPTMFPGAPELCDGKDNTCAGTTPGGEDDADGDGVRVCAGDCDDADPTTYPGAVELCDGHDNVCSGGVLPNEVDLDGDGAFPCTEPGDERPIQRSVEPGCGDCSHAGAAPSVGALAALLAAACGRRRSERP